MSESKQQVLLVVLIETASLGWRVAGIALDGSPVPLMRSEPGNLRPYRGVPFDEQVNFLRHRLSGVLQRGCDRLWGQQMKPCQIVFVADSPFQDAPAELTQAVADHFVEWMVNPPVAFFVCEGRSNPHEPPPLQKVAGEIAAENQDALDAGLAPLFAAAGQSELWELAPSKT
jgi:hypothetical protein